MQVQLRPSAQRFHPLMRPMYRRAGFAGLGADPGVNSTTIWTPSGGWVGSGGPAAVFQAPANIPVPACASDTQPGGAAFSQACIDQVLAAQQQRMAGNTAANYAVDRSNCETAWAENDARYKSLGIQGPPNDCAQRTYGLTLPGTTGGTAADIPNAQALLDPNYSGPGAGSPGVGTQQQPPPPQLTPSSIKFTNLTSGNSGVLNVGDRWQIQISNAARNAPVSVTGGQNGAHDTTPMGSSDSNGNWTSNGQITADQIGSWTEAWTVGGQPVGQFSFTVPGGTAGRASTSGQTVTGSFSDLLNKSVTVGGTSIPEWALIGAGVVALIVLMKVMK